MEYSVSEFRSFYKSPVGDLILESSGHALTKLDFADKADIKEVGCCELSVFKDTVRWLDVYFSGGIPDFMPNTELHGSDFRLDVWEIIKAIPYGELMTYGELASMIAAKLGIRRMSAQAVGGAVGHNPISIIIPCHRVVGIGGRLTGYTGGLDKKRGLLLTEGFVIENDRVKKKNT